jgi:GTP cyclohydrolase I
MTAKRKLTSAPPVRPSREAAEAAVKTLIAWVGEDPEREGLQDTPRRVVSAFGDYFSGYEAKAQDILARTFSETGGYEGPVLIRNITVESRCEHHLAPFIGKAHVAYIPSGRIVGLSKIARLVDIYSHRMQTQERLTAEISGAIERYLKPKGVAILIDTEHFCMKVRGVRDDATTITTSFTGAYKKDADLREEFLRQIAL